MATVGNRVVDGKIVSGQTLYTKPVLTDDGVVYVTVKPSVEGLAGKVLEPPTVTITDDDPRKPKSGLNTVGVIVLVCLGLGLFSLIVNKK